MMPPLNRPRFQTTTSRRQKQSGVVLIFALVALVVITLASVATVRNTTVEEKVAGATRDRNKAFQAAEYALRECLLPLQNNTYVGNQIPPAQNPTTPPTPPIWDDPANWANNISREITMQGVGSNYLAANPRCLIETLGGAGSGSYRVTARALGASDTTAVMLQATFSIQ